MIIALSLIIVAFVIVPTVVLALAFRGLHG
jgi:hypothetical protein